MTLKELRKILVSGYTIPQIKTALAQMELVLSTSKNDDFKEHLVSAINSYKTELEERGE